MAQLVCRSCRNPVTAGDLICLACGANLAIDDAVVDSSAPLPGEMPAGDESEAARCPHCDRALSKPDEPLCPHCLEPIQAGYILRLDTPTDNGVKWEHLLLPGTSLELGRSPDHSPAAAILAAFDGVSRNHARVTVNRQRRATVTDLRSTNGTFVNDVPLREGTETELRPGSVLRLGSAVSLSLHDTQSEQHTE